MTLTVTGDAKLDNANDFDSVQGTVGGDAAITDADDLDFGAFTSANLTVNAGGPLTQSAAVAVAGLTTVNTTGNVTLNNAGNDFGTVAITDGVGGNAGIVALKDKNAVALDDVKSAGSVAVDTVAGSITVNAAKTVSAATTVGLTANSTAIAAAVTVNGTVSAGTDATVISNLGDVTVAAGGTVSADNDAIINAQGNAVVGGTVTANADGAGGGDATVISATGDVAFTPVAGGGAATVGGVNVNITALNNISTDSAAKPASGGFIPQDSAYHADVVATGKATLNAGISIGSSGAADTYLGVDAASVEANAGVGHVAIAAANGKDLTVDPAGITAGKDVSTYTTGTVKPNGVITAGGNITVTAKNYSGGPVKINVGGDLTVNNLQGGENPQLALFTTAGGKSNPKVTQQANHTIVFIDGRLAGGDIQAINVLGAVEAFPIQTPELKSEQGVFGNPTFLHDELDVANPLAVGAIDFILQEIPRITLSSDFPIEVDQQVAANGLSPTTSYWFGQHPQDEDSAEEAADENVNGSDSPVGEVE